MSNRLRSWFPRILLGALPACSPAAPVVQPVPAATATAAVAAPVARQVDAPTPITTASGATFTLPKSWCVTRLDGAIFLEGPEREMNIWILDVTGKPLDAAIAASWEKLRPGFKREIEDRSKPPARGGWDEIEQLNYVTTSEEDRAIIGNARRKGETVYVVLLDAPRSALSRRGAQMMQIFGGLKAPGQEEESFAGKTAHPFDEARAAEFDEFTKWALGVADVPGAAVAIVQDGKVAFEKGYGVRGHGRDVTPDTAFMIGSTTKSLTSLMIAKLIDEGLFEWDTPVTKLMPKFALAEPKATSAMTMRHTMCACTGLPRQDMEFLFEYGDSTPQQRFDELSKMTPTTGFGETFQYSNSLVSAGGWVAAAAAYPKLSLSDAYAKAMKTRVFEPLGMTRTTFVTAEAARGDHAIPHGIAFNGPAHRSFSHEQMPLSVEDAVVSVAPAGGAWSTVQDLARVMLVELARGKNSSGTQVISQASLLERRKPGVKIDDKAAYGLALMTNTRNDVLAISHGGNTLGFSCLWAFYPEHNIGIVVLANAQGANAFTGALQRRLVELLFDGKPEAKGNLEHRMKRRSEQIAIELTKLVSDPDWSQQRVGSYKNDALGKLDIRAQGEMLEVYAGEWASVARQRKGDDDVSTVMLLGPPLVGLEFIPKHGDLVLRASQNEYVFRR